MTSTLSAVLAFPPADPTAMAQAMQDKLSLYTDAWDLAQDLAAGIEEILVIDTRSVEHYRAGHIPGAVSLAHREMTPERLATLDPSKVYVTYCDGIGCNGSTKGAWKLASAGFRVKELLGGLDFWRRDDHPVQTGGTRGSLSGAPAAKCGC
ncbi:MULTISPECIES: rhodanese-like domain-containing protein [unclassified Halomonas]|uniref:rhodanese-like domain-containing protein n=1 Tax=unclassified Halomonas TaxID=2609666 RepID=UPI00209F5630|nr:MULTISPECIES: rhodanese-like domain-containing protein [unclassified Halomonas]MCP1312799.1 rhodanese-like domain-containing protein [Halomonas sp. 707D7]MCP1326939.1 rhodanese-like domain-containing protein [Halomonas sp. 707D4]